MVTIFHILALICCCNRIKDAREQGKLNELITEEHRIAREWKKKKQGSRLEIEVPIYKE